MDLALLIVAVVGSGGLTTLVLAWLQRRKTTADTELIGMSTAEGSLRMSEVTASRLTTEIKRLDEKVVLAQGTAVIANERADEILAIEIQCQADLLLLTSRYALLVQDAVDVKVINDRVQNRLTILEQRVVTAAEAVVTRAETAAEIVVADKDIAAGVVAGDATAAAATIAEAAEKAMATIASAAASAVRVIEAAATAPPNHSRARRTGDVGS